MLAAAVTRKQSNGGGAVRVIVHSADMINYCRSIAPELDRRDFVPLSPKAIATQLRGLRRDQVFIDHAVWELNHWRDLEALDRELRLMPRSAEPQVTAETPAP